MAFRCRCLRRLIIFIPVAWFTLIVLLLLVVSLREESINSPWEPYIGNVLRNARDFDDNINDHMHQQNVNQNMTDFDTVDVDAKENDNKHSTINVKPNDGVRKNESKILVSTEYESDEYYSDEYDSDEKGADDGKGNNKNNIENNQPNNKDEIINKIIPPGNKSTEYYSSEYDDPVEIEDDAKPGVIDDGKIEKGDENLMLDDGPDEYEAVDDEELDSDKNNENGNGILKQDSNLKDLSEDDVAEELAKPLESDEYKNEVDVLNPDNGVENINVAEKEYDDEENELINDTDDNFENEDNVAEKLVEPLVSGEYNDNIENIILEDVEANNGNQNMNADEYINQDDNGDNAPVDGVQDIEGLKKDKEVVAAGNDSEYYSDEYEDDEILNDGVAIAKSKEIAYDSRKILSERGQGRDIDTELIKKVDSKDGMDILSVNNNENAIVADNIVHPIEGGNVADQIRNADEIKPYEHENIVNKDMNSDEYANSEGGVAEGENIDGVIDTNDNHEYSDIADNDINKSDSKADINIIDDKIGLGDNKDNKDLPEENPDEAAMGKPIYEDGDSYENIDNDKVIVNDNNANVNNNVEDDIVNDFADAKEKMADDANEEVLQADDLSVDGRDDVVDDDDGNTGFDYGNIKNVGRSMKHVEYEDNIWNDDANATIAVNTTEVTIDTNIKADDTIDINNKTHDIEFNLSNKNIKAYGEVKNVSNSSMVDSDNISGNKVNEIRDKTLRNTKEIHTNTDHNHDNLQDSIKSQTTPSLDRNNVLRKDKSSDESKGKTVVPYKTGTETRNMAPNTNSSTNSSNEMHPNVSQSRLRSNSTFQITNVHNEIQKEPNKTLTNGELSVYITRYITSNPETEDKHLDKEKSAANKTIQKDIKYISSNPEPQDKHLDKEKSEANKTIQDDIKFIWEESGATFSFANANAKVKDSLNDTNVMKYPAAVYEYLTKMSYLDKQGDYGPGSLGSAVVIDLTKLSPHEKQYYDVGFKNNSFNLMASEKMSFHRTLKDVRPKSCRRITYPVNLPSTSVIITFYNEAWSTLLRTVHSVLDRSPPHLLKEIVLVDDFSDHWFLGLPLEAYIENHPKVRLIRNTKREGLIRSRINGAHAAAADVFTYLDSHCEVTKGWLEPLLHRISLNITNVAVPIIESIHDHTMKYISFGAFSIGGFTWNLLFNWFTIPPQDLRFRKESDPIRTPTMAGGLFTIHRTFFEKIGLYDPGFDVWGGENLELSFKTWMCGGRVDQIPCSHVGHIFRAKSPYTWALPGSKHPLRKNTIRLAEVWLDEYKDFFYERTGWVKVPYGDISARLELRQKLQCHSFDWYMRNVWPSAFNPKDALIRGEIRNNKTEKCVTGRAPPDVAQSTAATKMCKTWSANNYWLYTQTGEIRREMGCLDYPGKGNIMILRCHGKGGPQKWKMEGSKVVHLLTKKCLTLDTLGRGLRMDECADTPLQEWTFGFHFPH